MGFNPLPAGLRSATGCAPGHGLGIHGNQALGRHNLSYGPAGNFSLFNSGSKRSRGYRRCWRGKRDQLRELNDRFHFAIYEAADAPLISQLIKTVWTRAPRDTFRLLPDRPERSLKAHGDIVETDREGDVPLYRERIEIGVNSPIGSAYPSRHASKMAANISRGTRAVSTTI